MDLTTAKYRITYEAFSKFSASISKAENIETLAAIIHKKSKYLFDYKLLRIAINKKENVSVFTFTTREVTYDEGGSSLYKYERKLLDNQIPFCKELKKNLFDAQGVQNAQLNPLLWGWHFQYNELNVCTSILADDSKQFVNGDIEILHLLVDTVITKFKELQFKKELECKNQNLKEALLLIEKKNIEINQIVDNQKTIIAARTKEIRGKNNKLLEISKMNAHDVREPLSRILGLVELAGHLSPEELQNDVLGFLKESAQDLDHTLKEIIEMSAGEINKLSVD